MTTGQPAAIDAVRYVGAFDSPKQTRPPLVLRGHRVDGVEREEMWLAQFGEWRPSNVAYDIRYGHSERTLVALTPDPAQHYLDRRNDDFQRRQRWVSRYQQGTSPPRAGRAIR